MLKLDTDTSTPTLENAPTLEKGLAVKEMFTSDRDCEIERERECVCVRVSERVSERECVRVSVRVRESVRVRVRVCIRERERERERERIVPALENRQRWKMGKARSRWFEIDLASKKIRRRTNSSRISKSSA